MNTTAKTMAGVLSSLLIIFSLIAFTGCTDSKNESKVSDTKETAGRTEGADAYKIDPKQSIINWTGKKVTGQHNGTIAIDKGEIYADNGNVVAGKFDIDVSTIKVLDITDQGSNEKLTNHLKSDDFFSAEKHRYSKFEITNAVKDASKGPDAYNVSGNLTIKGITKNITFPATINVNGNTLKAKAEFDVDRTEWDIKFRSGKFFENLGDNMINDNFTLQLDITAVK
jgi:polyisoprenoid-binding protein YceI